MSAERLREAARAERDEWGGERNAKNYPKSAAIHLAVADWLDHECARWESKIAHGGNAAAVWAHERDALAVADAILGSPR